VVCVRLVGVVAGTVFARVRVPVTMEAAVAAFEALEVLREPVLPSSWPMPAASAPGGTGIGAAGAAPAVTIT